MNELLTLQEVCERLRVTYRTALRYVRDKKIKASRVGGRWRIDSEDLRRFMETPNEGEFITLTDADGNKQNVPLLDEEDD